jgi:hypothetical protein
MTAPTLRTMGHPIRQDQPEAPYQWRDNAYLGFWDAEKEVYGSVHVSTSPNAEGLRARASISVGGQSIEMVEELAPCTFTGRQIDFGLDGRIRVIADDLLLDVRMSPRSPVADYSRGGVLSDLVPDEPLQHLQQAVQVDGEVAIRGRAYQQATIHGRGLRDRTWGYRDESVSMHEFAFLMVGLPDRDISVIKFLHGDGSTKAHGFVLAQEATEFHALDLTWDAAGQVCAADLNLGDGHTLTLRRTATVGGFWVPMGVERRGPAMSCYDQFVGVETPDGERGYGIFEAGIIRRLF